MYTRLLKKLTRSAFVFGPRGVGKSTWARTEFPSATTFDLMDMELFLELTVDPNTLYRRLDSLDEGAWVFIDEIQRIPDLLNEVHRLIENKRLNVLMTGSSARKLRRGGVNLLGGRASHKLMFPLVSAELGDDFDLAKVLQYGCLPSAIQEGDETEYLRSYVQTYVAQEIVAEALVRNLGNFARFLEIAARQNGQTVNHASIAADVGVNRRTVVSHFDILIDTLLGTWLPAWRRKTSNKQLQQSKFYFFDCGVVRAIMNTTSYPPNPEERGALIETLIYNEMRAYLEYANLHFPISYWRTYDGAEVDFVVETPERIIAIEVKNSSSWQRKFNRGLRRFAREAPQSYSIRCFGIYSGSNEQLWEDIHVVPVIGFLKRLWNGEIIS